MHNVTRRRQRRNFRELQNNFLLDGVEPIVKQLSRVLKSSNEEKDCAANVLISDKFFELAGVGKFMCLS